MLRRIGRPGLIGTVARTAVIAGTATATSNAVNRHSQAKAQQAQDAQADTAEQAAPPPPPAEAPAPEPAPAPAAAPAPGSVDIVGQLTQLASLRDAGALTPEQFEAAKNQLLS